MKKKGIKPAALAVAIALFLAFLSAAWIWHSQPGYELSPGNHVVEQAYHENRSGMMVEVSGKVVRLIETEKNEGSLQWFQIATPNGLRLMVAHDHGPAEPIPLKPRDEVTVRGRYEWTETGGTLRNTERDSSLSRLHGWILHDGRKYD